MSKNEREKYTALYHLAVEIPIYAASFEEARRKAEQMEDSGSTIISQLAESDGDADIDNVTFMDLWEDARTQAGYAE